MMVQHVSTVDFFPKVSTGGRGFSPENAHLIAELTVLSHVLQAMLEISRTNREIRRVENRQRRVDRDDADSEATRTEGQRRHVEARLVETDGDVTTHASRPHRALRLHHTGLNLPV